MQIRILAILLILATSCGGLKKMAENVEGTYYGYLPCADCPGIYYELMLNPDFTYSETIRYDGIYETFSSRNSYTLTMDSVIILNGRSEMEGMNRFVFNSGKLEMLSMEGEKIVTGFPEMYILTKDRPVVPVEAEPFTASGFKAAGNEPFWSLEIEFHNLLRFTSLTEEFPELDFPMPDPERPGDLSLVKYSARTYNAEIEVSISREECMDNMSGYLFPYTVNVYVRNSHDEQFTELKGCGRYQGNYRINDIWTLELINGKEIEIKNPARYPRLEIDLAGKAVYGFGGCNRFHGKAELLMNGLLTGSIVSTRMACIDIQDVENKFLSTLSGKTLGFSFLDNGLILNDGETELVFSRAE